LTNAACGAGKRPPSTHTILSGAPPQRRASPANVAIPGATLPPNAAPSVSKMSRFVATTALAGKSAKRVWHTCSARVNAGSMLSPSASLVLSPAWHFALFDRQTPDQSVRRKLPLHCSIVVCETQHNQLMSFAVQEICYGNRSASMLFVPTGARESTQASSCQCTFPLTPEGVPPTIPPVPGNNPFQPTFKGR
jgi:hypothetical protein